MDTRENTVSEHAHNGPLSITSVGRAVRLRRVGHVPLAIFSDPRFVRLTTAARLLLVTAYALARRDDSQRIDGQPMPLVGWLVVPEVMPARHFARLLGMSRRVTSDAFDALADVDLLVISDALIWGAPGWESEAAPRIRSLRALRKAAANMGGI